MSNIPSPSPILAPNGRPFVHGNPGRVRSTLAKSTVDEKRQEITKLVESTESDPQFLLGITVIRALATSATVSIEVDGETSQTQALVDNLMDVWSATLPEALKCFGYGRIAFEKIYGLYDSKAGIRPLEKLEPLPFESTEMRICKDDGRYQGIKLKIKSNEVDLDPPETWWLALDPTPKNPYGQSRYRGAPEEVLKERKKLSKNEGIFQDKFALGHGVGYAPSKYPDGDSNVDASGQPTNPMDDMANGVRNMWSGAVLVLDSAVDPKTNQPLFRYEAPQTKQDASPLENRRRILDAYALRSIGVPERAVTQDDATGSYAMAEVHWKVLQNTVEGLLNAIVVSFQKYVIDPVVLLNCPSANRPTLKLVAQPIRDDLRPLVIDLVKSVIAAPQVSPLLAQGVIDLEKLVEASGLPLGPDVQEAIARVRQISATMLQPPAPTPGPSFMAAALPADARLLAQHQPPANGSPPIDGPWDSHAEALAARIAAKHAELTRALQSPTEVDRRGL